jgi:hypothetical protein
MTLVHTFILDAHRGVLTVNLTQDTPLWGEPSIQAHHMELEKKKLKKMPNFKLNSNFNWMKMQIGR